MRSILLTIGLAAATAPATGSLAPPAKAVTPAGPIQEVVTGPVFGKPFACTEHPEGQLAYVGDALGTDCLVIGGLEDGTGFGEDYRTTGATNSDWYGWREDVLAPFDGVVDAV